MSRAYQVPTKSIKRQRPAYLFPAKRNSGPATSYWHTMQESKKLEFELQVSKPRPRQGARRAGNPQPKSEILDQIGSALSQNGYGIQAIIPVFQPSQPSQARQASQPGQPGIEASGLQASMSAILSIGVPMRALWSPTGRHKAGTGRITLWHPQHQGWQPNMPQTYQISMILANRVMGRLWDDHFMDLRYPSKFYRVQDAVFIDGSSI